MEAKIINYIKEKQKEYKYGSDAYNVLRHLEVTLPQFLTQPNNTGDDRINDVICCTNCRYLYNVTDKVICSTCVNYSNYENRKYE